MQPAVITWREPQDSVHKIQNRRNPHRRLEDDLGLILFYSGIAAYLISYGYWIALLLGAVVVFLEWKSRIYRFRITYQMDENGITANPYFDSLTPPTKRISWSEISAFRLSIDTDSIAALILQINNNQQLNQTTLLLNFSEVGEEDLRSFLNLYLPAKENNLFVIDEEVAKGDGEKFLCPKISLKSCIQIRLSNGVSLPCREAFIALNMAFSSLFRLVLSGRIGGKVDKLIGFHPLSVGYGFLKLITSFLESALVASMNMVSLIAVFSTGI